MVQTRSSSVQIDTRRLNENSVRQGISPSASKRTKQSNHNLPPLTKPSINKRRKSSKLLASSSLKESTAYSRTGNGKNREYLDSNTRDVNFSNCKVSRHPLTSPAGVGQLRSTSTLPPLAGMPSSTTKIRRESRSTRKRLMSTSGIGIEKGTSTATATVTATVYINKTSLPSSSTKLHQKNKISYDDAIEATIKSDVDTGSNGKICCDDEKDISHDCNTNTKNNMATNHSNKNTACHPFKHDSTSGVEIRMKNDDNTSILKGINFEICSDLLSLPDPPIFSSREKKRHNSQRHHNRRRRQSSPIIATSLLSSTPINKHHRQYPLVDRTNYNFPSLSTSTCEIDSSAVDTGLRKRHCRNYEPSTITKHNSSDNPATNDHNNYKNRSKPDPKDYRSAKKARRSLCHVPSPTLQSSDEVYNSKQSGENATTINSNSCSSDGGLIVYGDNIGNSIDNLNITKASSRRAALEKERRRQSIIPPLDMTKTVKNREDIEKSLNCEERLEFVPSTDNNRMDSFAADTKKHRRKKRQSIVIPRDFNDLISQDDSDSPTNAKAEDNFSHATTTENSSSNQNIQSKKRQSILLPINIDKIVDDAETRSIEYHNMKSTKRNKYISGLPRHSFTALQQDLNCASNLRQRLPVLNDTTASRIANSIDSVAPTNANWNVSTKFDDVRKLVREYCALQQDEREHSYHSRQIMQLTGGYSIVSANVMQKQQSPKLSPRTSKSRKILALQKVGPVMEEMEMKNVQYSNKAQHLTKCRVEKIKSGKYRYYDIYTNNQVPSKEYSSRYMYMLSTQRKHRLEMWGQLLEQIEVPEQKIMNSKDLVNIDYNNHRNFSSSNYTNDNNPEEEAIWKKVRSSPHKKDATQLTSKPPQSLEHIKMSKSTTANNYRNCNHHFSSNDMHMDTIGDRNNNEILEEQHIGDSDGTHNTTTSRNSMICTGGTRNCDKKDESSAAIFTKGKYSADSSDDIGSAIIENKKINNNELCMESSYLENKDIPNTIEEDLKNQLSSLKDSSKKILSAQIEHQARDESPSSVLLPIPSRDGVSYDPDIAKSEQKLWKAIDHALEEYSKEVISIMDARKKGESKYNHER